MLVNGSADRVKLIKETSMLEAVTKQMYDNIAEPRVLNSHIPFHYLPKNTLEQKCKILFVQRNPKDICVSYFNHHSKILEYEYEGKFENYVKRFLNGTGKLLSYRFGGGGGGGGGGGRKREVVMLTLSQTSPVF